MVQRLTEGMRDGKERRRVDPFAPLGRSPFALETGGVPYLFSLSYNDVSSTVDDKSRVTMWRFCNVVRDFRDDSAAGWRNEAKALWKSRD